MYILFQQKVALTFVPSNTHFKHVKLSENTFEIKNLIGSQSTVIQNLERHFQKKSILKFTLKVKSRYISSRQIKDNLNNQSLTQNYKSPILSSRIRNRGLQCSPSINDYQTVRQITNKSKFGLKDKKQDLYLRNSQHQIRQNQYEEYQKKKQQASFSLKKLLKISREQTNQTLIQQLKEQVLNLGNQTLKCEEINSLKEKVSYLQQQNESLKQKILNLQKLNKSAKQQKRIVQLRNKQYQQTIFYEKIKEKHSIQKLESLQNQLHSRQIFHKQELNKKQKKIIQLLNSTRQKQIEIQNLQDKIKVAQNQFRIELFKLKSNHERKLQKLNNKNQNQDQQQNQKLKYIHQSKDSDNNEVAKSMNLFCNQSSDSFIFKHIPETQSMFESNSFPQNKEPYLIDCSQFNEISSISINQPENTIILGEKQQRSVISKKSKNFGRSVKKLQSY